MVRERSELLLFDGVVHVVHVVLHLHILHVLHVLHALHVLHILHILLHPVVAERLHVVL